MSTIGMTTQPVTVREFMGENVNYRSNDDLCHELRRGENQGIGGGTAEGVVLVMLNMDHEPYAVVEVAGRGQELHADTIDAAIESLTVVRDALRKLAVAA